MIEELNNLIVPYFANGENTDLRNIINHSLDLVQKNTSITNNKLHCIMNDEVVNSKDWNDIHVIKNFNKTSMFGNDIRDYKQALTLVDTSERDVGVRR